MKGIRSLAIAAAGGFIGWVSLFGFTTMAWSAAGTAEFPGFHRGAAIVSLDRTADGKLIGAVGSLSVENDFGVTRFNSKGRLDETFGEGGFARPFSDESIYPDGQAKGVAVAPDGRIAAVGYRAPLLSGASGMMRAPAIAMLRPTGAYDRRFGLDGLFTTPYRARPNEEFNDAVFQGRRLIVVGSRNPQYLKGQAGIVRAYLPDGTVDSSFARTGDLVIERIGKDSTDSDASAFHSVRLRPDGRLVIGGIIDGRQAIITLKENGRLDRSFSRDGVVRLQGDVLCTICGGSDKTTVGFGPGGSIFLQSLVTNKITIQKLTRKGSPDRRYGRNSIVRTPVRAIHRQFEVFPDLDYKKPSGFLWGDMAVSRSGATTVAVTATGREIEESGKRGSYFRASFIAYRPNGRIDRKFGNEGVRVIKGGSASAASSAMALTSRGKVWVGGVNSFEGSDYLALWRFRR